LNGRPSVDDGRGNVCDRWRDVDSGRRGVNDWLQDVDGGRSGVRWVLDGSSLYAGWSGVRRANSRHWLFRCRGLRSEGNRLPPGFLRSERELLPHASGQ
jgi:hypothetical protein